MKKIIQSGISMAREWILRIENARNLRSYTLADGRKFTRIAYGEEGERWGAKPCWNCGVVKGQLHVPDCEYEKCPCCGLLFSEGCSCEWLELMDSEDLTEDEKHASPRKGFYDWFWIGFCILAGMALLRAILMVFDI